MPEYRHSECPNRDGRLPLYAEERVFRLLDADGGGRPVTGVDHGVVGQDEQPAADVFYQLVEVAPCQVGPADAALEEHVAREHAAVGRAVVDQASGRVAGHVDGLQARAPEGDDVAVVQIPTQWHGLLLQLEAEHAALLGRLVQQELVGLVGLGLQPELAQQEGVAEDVVRVQVCVQQMFHVQLFFLDEVFQSYFFFFVKTARVDDDRFVGLVPKHVTVLGEHIELKSFNLHGLLY